MMDVSLLFLLKSNSLDPSNPRFHICVLGLVLRMRLRTCLLGKSTNTELSLNF